MQEILGQLDNRELITIQTKNLSIGDEMMSSIDQKLCRLHERCLHNSRIDLVMSEVEDTTEGSITVNSVIMTFKTTMRNSNVVTLLNDIIHDLDLKLAEWKNTRFQHKGGF